MPEDTLGERLKRAKKAKGANNGEIAAAAGVTDVTVSRWLNDVTKPGPEELDRAADFLGANRQWLRYGHPAPGDSARLTNLTLPTFDRNPLYRHRLPPRAYERVYEYLGRMEQAGASEEQMDLAERLMNDERYGKLNSKGPSTRTEDDVIEEIDAAWAFVWELATRGGLTIPGPRPRFEEARSDR